jgi:hypothetical protein
MFVVIKMIAFFTVGISGIEDGGKSEKAVNRDIADPLGIPGIAGNDFPRRRNLLRASEFDFHSTLPTQRFLLLIPASAGMTVGSEVLINATWVPVFAGTGG